MRFNNGITLVELMVTVAVIGILGVVAVPAYQEYIRTGDTGKCAKYILGSRLNATSLINMQNEAIANIDEAALGLVNSNNECSGGVSVTESSGDLIIRGNTGSAGGSSTRRFIMTLTSTTGSWSCQTTDASGTVIQAGSCTDVKD